MMQCGTHTMADINTKHQTHGGRKNQSLESGEASWKIILEDDS